MLQIYAHLVPAFNTVGSDILRFSGEKVQEEIKKKKKKEREEKQTKKNNTLLFPSPNTYYSGYPRVVGPLFQIRAMASTPRNKLTGN